MRVVACTQSPNLSVFKLILQLVNASNEHSELCISRHTLLCGLLIYHQSTYHRDLKVTYFAYVAEQSGDMRQDCLRTFQEWSHPVGYNILVCLALQRPPMRRRGHPSCNTV